MTLNPIQVPTILQLHNTLIMNLQSMGAFNMWLNTNPPIERKIMQGDLLATHYSNALLAYNQLHISMGLLFAHVTKGETNGLK